MREWVPSQKGLFTEPPQRQRENAALPVRSYGLPSESTSSIVPSGASTRYGPFWRHVIFTCAMYLLRCTRRGAPCVYCNGVLIARSHLLESHYKIGLGQAPARLGGSPSQAFRQ